MISLYTGSVGSGKSFHAIDLGLKIINDKKHGEYRTVIANFPINRKEDIRFGTKKMKQKSKEKNDAEMERWIYEDEISVEYLVAKSLENGWFGKESCCMVIIDEAGIIFNSRDWQVQADSRNKWIKFLALSRKFGYDFIFVAQGDRMIDRQIRSLCEYEVKHLNANNSIMFSFLHLFRITLFMYIYQWYQTKIRGNLRFGLFKKRIAARYDTMRIFNFDDLIESVKGMYDGKIIPAPVAVQCQLWEEEKVKREALRRLEEEKQRAEYEAMTTDDLEKLYEEYREKLSS